ncbi:HDOD domain-containing protein [Massilia sp. ZL223]|uniref:HDOD domain-containing protein n=1 Tax=Massilia sp. ZL223 TaxID=2824904 RepID=UPI001B81E945|nr:HDOD domain-containing protein [Massilia sp. ZL223]MBQ5964165.1 HDOD domain-containing protein [Massilia sp. ZL223]
MKNWLARLFGSARDDTPTREPAPQPSAVPDTVANPPRGDDAVAGLDLAFYRWLAGPCSAAVPGGTLLIDELARLAGQPEAAAGLVPRVPAVIPQLLRSLRDEGSSAADLARQLSQDAVLVAEVIREVNSPYYRPATPVRNIEGALLLLGQNGLRMLLARVAFRPVISMQPGQLARQLAPTLWNQSEKCALAASLLAPAHGADPFEAYLAGLMHNIGLVVALRVADQALPGALPDDDGFAAALLGAARLLSSRIAAAWDLPPAVACAIAQPDGGLLLAGALAAGDRLAKLRLLADAAQPGFVRSAGALAPQERKVFDQLSESED